MDANMDANVDPAQNDPVVVVDSAELLVCVDRLARQNRLLRRAAAGVTLAMAAVVVVATAVTAARGPAAKASAIAAPPGAAAVESRNRELAARVAHLEDANRRLSFAMGEARALLREVTADREKIGLAAAGPEAGGGK